MQRMFADDTPWHDEWINEVLSQIEELAERFPEKTIFTRFISPVRPEDMPRRLTGNAPCSPLCASISRLAGHENDATLYSGSCSSPSD